MKRPYAIIFKPSVSKDIRHIPNADLALIRSRIEALGQDPFPTGVKPLSGYDYYRIRVGQYRVIYEVLAKVLVIMVIGIGHRKDMYRKIRRLR